MDVDHWETNAAKSVERKSRKIIFFVTTLTAGGAERVLASYVERAKKGPGVGAVICLNWTADRRLKDRLIPICPVIELSGAPNAGFVAQAWKAWQLCWSNRDAAFQGWMYHGCVMATFFWWLTGSANSIYWAIHSSGLSGQNKLLLRAIQMIGLGFLGKITGAGVIYCGENSRRVHVERWHWPRSNSTVLKNGINTNRFIPSPEIRARVRSELGIASHAIIVGYVGRWHPDKDVGLLCRALAGLDKPNPDLIVLFCGSGLDEKNREFAEAMAQASSKIKCIGLGEVMDTSQLIPAFDLLCLCSRREAFPLVLCEALACGVPCLATDVGDCRGIINGFGRVVPPGDADQLGRAIAEYALSLRDSSMPSKKRAARMWAEESLDEAKAAERYLTLLNAAILQ